MSHFVLKLEEEFDFALIEITAHIKDFKLCWKINNSLDFKFERIKDIELFDKKLNQNFFFSCYEYIIEEDHSTFYFISNKDRNGFLIKELPHIDFFIMIKGYCSTLMIDNIKKSIKNLSEVLHIKEIDPNELNSAENFIF